MKYLVFIALFLSACNSTIERYPEPQNLLSEEEMVEIMTDLMKTESYIQNRDLSVSKYYKTMIKSGQAIFKQHNISESQFEESLKYYGSRQQKMEHIYDEVLNNLNDELAKLPMETTVITNSDTD